MPFLNELAGSGAEAVVLLEAPSYSETTWTTIVSEGFEGTFPGRWILNGNPTWGKLNWHQHLGSYSAWCAWQGHTGEGTDYFPNMDARMTYGPFSLSGATEAQATWSAWFNTEGNRDWYCLLVSHDGTNFGRYYSRFSFPVTRFEGSVYGHPTLWQVLLRLRRLFIPTRSPDPAN